MRDVDVLVAAKDTNSTAKTLAVVAQKLVILEMWQAASDLGLLGCGTAAHMSVHRNTSRWYVRYYVSRVGITQRKP